MLLADEHENAGSVDLGHSFIKARRLAAKHRYQQNGARVAFTLFDNRTEPAERFGEPQNRRHFEVRGQPAVHNQV